MPAKSRQPKRPPIAAKASRSPLDIAMPGGAWWLRRAAWWGLLVALAAFLLALWEARLIPSVGTDGLIYHLTLPAQWLQHGYLSLHDLPFHDGIAQYSPALSESLCYLLMRLTGDEHLCWLIQPVFMLGTVYIFYQSARLVGAGRPIALLLSGILFVYEPFDASVIVVNNDIILTAGAAIYLYGLLATRVPKGWPLAWAAAGLGLMLATKYIGVIYAAVGVLVALPFAWGYLRRRIRLDHRRGRAVGEVALALGLLLAGSFFLLRNWALYGNPMYPAQVRLLGVTIFKGLYDTSVFARQGLDAAGLYRMFINDKAQFGMHLPFSALLWLGLAGMIVLWFVRRRNLRVLAVGLIWPLVGAAIFFAVTPFWREHRLLHPIYYTLWLSGAYALSVPLAGVGRKARPIITWMLLVALVLYLYFLWFKDSMVLLYIMVLAAGLVLLPWRRRRLRQAAVSAVVAGMAAVAVMSPWWYPQYRTHRMHARPVVYLQSYDNRGKVWNEVDRLSAAGPVHVAYSGTPIIFTLFGPDLANSVSYVPLSVDDHPQATPLQPDVNLSLQLAQWRRKNKDVAYWLDGLGRRQIDLLYLFDDPTVGGVGPELEMTRANPDRFELLLQSENAYLYRVLKGSLIQPSAGR